MKKALVYITRKEHFNAAHRLFNPRWSDAKNEEVFGICANKNWHGHNYALYITLKGEPDPDTGMILNVKDLSKLVKREVLDLLDHKNLNVDVSFLEGIIPSTENLAIAIWNQLEPLLPNGCLHCIKVQETETIYAEYFGT